MVWELFQKGQHKKQIATLLDLDPKTVRRILRISSGESADSNRRSDLIPIHTDLLEKVFQDCHGFAQRTWEVLTESHGYKGSYSSIKRMIHDLGLRKRGKKDHRATEGELLVHPGEEMQHDTSPYFLDLGGKKTFLQCSELYYRYSKMRYVVFYPSFDRFAMKAFFHEALTFFGYSAHRCVIDNTHLAVLRGTGQGAVFVPEMIAFAKSMGFVWLAHRIKHADRKGGKERGFRTINQNFLPGRIFKSLSDLNRQAFHWATERFARRPSSKTRLIPIEIFEQEKPFLNKLPEGLPPPYREHARTTDEYGYLSFGGNFYWVPGSKRREKVQVIEYPKWIRAYRGRDLIAEYPLAGKEERNQKFKLPGAPDRQPRQLERNSSEEEKKLISMGEDVQRYIQWAKKESGQVNYPNKWICDLYQFSRQLAPAVFQKMIERASQYGITKVDALERIALLLIKAGSAGSYLDDLPPSSSYENRKAYEEGRFCEEPDLKTYANLLGLERGDKDESEYESNTGDKN